MFKNDDEREGALLRRLKEAGQPRKTTSIGFSTGMGAGNKKRAIVVVARVAYSPTLGAAVEAALTGGADAVEIALGPDSAADPTVLGAALTGRDKPCGVYFAGGVNADLDALIDAGPIDWLHLALDAPAHLLHGKGPTRAVSISLDLAPNRLPGLPNLKTDLVVIEGGAGDASPSLTLDAFLALRTIQSAAKGPVLVGPGLGLLPGDAALLLDHNVEGVLVDVDVDAASLGAWITAIEALDQ